MQLSTENTADAVSVVTVSGDIDMSTAPQLGQLLGELADAGARQIVVDVNRVDFLDSSALGVLVSVHKRLVAVQGTVKLVCDQPRIERIFAITRLAEVIPVFETVEAASAG